MQKRSDELSARDLDLGLGIDGQFYLLAFLPSQPLFES